MLLPIHVSAATQNKQQEQDVKQQIAYQPYAGNIIFNTPGVPDLKSWDDYQTKQIIALKKKPQQQAKVLPKAGLNCVQFAKAYLGIAGTWGNGGRKLALNSGPVANAVMVFTYIHVGVVKQVTEGRILIIEGNYDNHGSVRERWMVINDPTIRGYHVF